MDGSLSIIEVMLSFLLFMVMFFGIGFLLNMLLRMTWLMAIIYPIVVILIVDEVRVKDYITRPGMAFGSLGEKLVSLHAADIIILIGGFVGALIAGIVMIILRRMGYRMF